MASVSMYGCGSSECTIGSTQSSPGSLSVKWQNPQVSGQKLAHEAPFGPAVYVSVAVTEEGTQMELQKSVRYPPIVKGREAHCP